MGVTGPDPALQLEHLHRGERAPADWEPAPGRAFIGFAEDNPAAEQAALV